VNEAERASTPFTRYITSSSLHIKTQRSEERRVKVNMKEKVFRVMPLLIQLK
jgi:hypothetical protein